MGNDARTPTIDTTVPVALIRVRGYHLDLYGHVNNARYLEFLEEGRWAAFEDRFGFAEWSERALQFNVVNVNINYRAAASLGQVLEVRTALEKIGDHSAVVRQEVVEQSRMRVVADALVTFVLVDASTGRAAVLTDDLRAEIEKMFTRP